MHSTQNGDVVGVMTAIVPLGGVGSTNADGLDNESSLVKTVRDTIGLVVYPMIE